MSVDNLVEIYIAVVAIEDFSLWLDGTNDLLEFLQFLRLYLGSLVEQDDVAELNLLDNQGCQVFFVDVVFHQVIAVGKLVLHAKGIHHCHDAIETQYAILDILRTEGWDGADGLCNRSWLADTARLDDDVVELLHIDYLLQLLYEVHLQRTADATVLESYERIVFLTYHAAFLNQGCVYVDFADVIDDDSELDTFLVGENLVEQGGLTTAQITCKQ